MSRSKKDRDSRNKGKKEFSLKRDTRKEANRGLRRHVKLEIKAGNTEDLPDVPQSKRVNDERLLD